MGRRPYIISLEDSSGNYEKPRNNRNYLMMPGECPLPGACPWGEHPKAAAPGPRLYKKMILPLSPPEQLPVPLPWLPEAGRGASGGPIPSI